LNAEIEFKNMKIFVLMTWFRGLLEKYFILVKLITI